MRENIKDQIYNIYFQHNSKKRRNIKATLNIGFFRYFRHEISEHTIE